MSPSDEIRILKNQIAQLTEAVKNAKSGRERRDLTDVIAGLKRQVVQKGGVI